MRCDCVWIEVKRAIKTWQRGTKLSELTRKATRKAGVEGEDITQREWLGEKFGKALRWLWRRDDELFNISAVMEIGPAHVWSIFGAPDVMLWLSACEIHIETYMWRACKLGGMLTTYGGRWSWRGKLYVVPGGLREKLIFLWYEVIRTIIDEKNERKDVRDIC